MSFQQKKNLRKTARRNIETQDSYNHIKKLQKVPKCFLMFNFFIFFQNINMNYYSFSYSRLQTAINANFIRKKKSFCWKFARNALLIIFHVHACLRTVVGIGIFNAATSHQGLPQPSSSTNLHSLHLLDQKYKFSWFFFADAAAKNGPNKKKIVTKADCRLCATYAI